MKNLFTLFLFFCIGYFSLGQSDSITITKDSISITEKRSSFHITSTGIFDPLRISINRKHELSIQPLLFFIIPNMKFERHWLGGWRGGKDGSFFAFSNYKIFSRHSFTIPTLLLKTFAREGTGGVLPVQSQIPFILTTKHQVFFQRTILPKRVVMTVGVGAELGFQGKNADFTTIDYPIIFPRTHVYHNNYLLQGDFITSIKISQRSQKMGCLGPNPRNTKMILLDLHSTYFHLPTDSDNYMAFEEALVLRRESWKKGYKLGVKYSYGTYPFGKESGLFPYFDIIFKFR